MFVTADVDLVGLVDKGVGRSMYNVLGVRQWHRVPDKVITKLRLFFRYPLLEVFSFWPLSSKHTITIQFVSRPWSMHSCVIACLSRLVNIRSDVKYVHSRELD